MLGFEKVIILRSNDVELLGFSLVPIDGISLEIDEGTDMGSLVGLFYGSHQCRSQGIGFLNLSQSNTVGYQWCHFTHLKDVGDKITDCLYKH